jgi:hypothetical protein
MITGQGSLPRAQLRTIHVSEGSICADIASMPVRTLLAHIWMFRAA